jgi:lysophospholipase L1-like esterase
MLVRPEGEGNAFPRLLEGLLNERSEKLWVVESLSRIAGMVSDADLYLSHVVANPPDVILLHYGHVEAVPRRQPRSVWLRAHLYRPGESERRRRLNVVARKYSGARRRLGYWVQWMPRDEFKRRLSELTEYLQKETGARILVLEANPGDSRLESLAPGACAALAGYNETLRAVAAERGVELVELSEASLGRPVVELTPDGTHFDAKAHRAIAEALARRILG